MEQLNLFQWAREHPSKPVRIRYDWAHAEAVGYKLIFNGSSPVCLKCIHESFTHVIGDIKAGYRDMVLAGETTPCRWCGAAFP